MPSFGPALFLGLALGAAGLSAAGSSPLQANLQYNLALRQFQSQKTQDALASLAKALAESPEHPQANLLLGIIHAQAGRWQEALAPLKTATQRLPENADAQNNLGVVYFQLERYGDAEACFRKVVSLRPERTDAWMNLGVLGLKVKKPALAKEGFGKAAALDPSSNRAWLGVADAATALGERAAVAEAQQKALDLVPDDPPLRLALADNYYRLGELEKAAKAVEPLKDQGQPVAEFLLGVLAYRRGEFDASHDRFLAALAAKPDYPEARFNLAITLYDQGRYNEALAQFGEVLKLHPGDEEARRDMEVTRQAASRAFIRDGSHEFLKADFLTALERWRAALALDPSNKPVKDLLASAQTYLKLQADELAAKAGEAWKAGKKEEAIQGWIQSLARDPLNAAAQSGLAGAKVEVAKFVAVYDQQARADLAEGRLKRAAETAAKAAALDRVKGAALVEEVKKEAAIQLAKALKQADAARARHAFEEEVDALAKGVELAPEDQGLLLRLNQAKVALRLALDAALDEAKKAEQAGKWAAAAKAYRRALETQSANGAAREGLKRAEAKAKERSKAPNAAELDDLYYQGVYAYAGGEAAKATTLWKKVLAAQPGHALAREALERAERRARAIQKN